MHATHCGLVVLPSKVTADRGFTRLTIRIEPGVVWFDGEIHQLQFSTDFWLNEFAKFIANGWPGANCKSMRISIDSRFLDTSENPLGKNEEKERNSVPPTTILPRRLSR